LYIITPLLNITAPLPKEVNLKYYGFAGAQPKAVSCDYKRNYIKE
jgi:hypothetical protein